MVSISILTLTRNKSIKCLAFVYLIPQPLLPGEKGSKKKIISVLSPSPLGESLPRLGGGFRESWREKQDELNLFSETGFRQWLNLLKFYKDA
jgi:hypothetical protein